MSVVKRAFDAMFVPDGYPHTVAPEYLEYQLWDTLQGLCQYLKGVLTAMALYK
eukprot:gene6064-16050_t